MDYYCQILAVLFLVLSVTFIIFCLDDLLIDICYWGNRAYKFLMGKNKSYSLQELRSVSEKMVAVMIPTWREEDVIAQMINSNSILIEYSAENYMVFVGVYQNDSDTARALEDVIEKFGNVKKVVVPHDGPTCKADCLNWVIQAIFLHEKQNDMSFDMIVMHDAEDVVHPLELKLFNYLIRTHDLIQIPVRPLEVAWWQFVNGVYLDEFAETHSKDMLVRKMLCKIIPSAGVATCFRPAILKKLSADHQGNIFNTDSLTEDYDISYRLAKYGIKQDFSLYPIDTTSATNIYNKKTYQKSYAYISVAEYFPRRLWRSIKQRTRWNIGIFFQSISKETWEGGFWKKYFFFRDRKGIISNILIVPAYFLFVNMAIFFVLKKLDLIEKVDLSVPAWLVYTNTFLFFERILQRFIFTTARYNFKQGFLSMPRIVVANFINFFTTLRALYIFFSARVAHKKIAWDKTSHHFPSMEQFEDNYKNIGYILLNRNIVTKEQHKKATQYSKMHNKDILQVLHERGYITRSEILHVISDSTGYPILDESLIDMGKSRELLSYAVCKKLHLFPIGISEGLFVVAVTKESRLTKLPVDSSIVHSSLLDIAVDGYVQLKQYVCLNKDMMNLIEKLK